MALFTTLAALSQTAGANPPDGSADAPSTIPTDLRLLGSFDAIMRDGGHQWASAVGGTNTIAITVNGISSLVAGQTFRFVAAGANTGAVTLNVNSLGAKSVNKYGSSALVAGDIANLSTVTVTYDGTNFQLLSPAGIQTYQNVSGSRAASTTYTNSTGRPIFVAIQCTGVSGSALNAALSVGGNVISYMFIPGFTSAASAVTVSAQVPDGATYVLTLPSGTFNWFELR